MKLGIFSNFGSGDGISGTHCGGSERVLKSIAEILVKSYNHEVSIYAYNYKQPSVVNGVNLFPCKRDNSTLISQINDNEHMFIYSDYFLGLPYIIQNLSKVVPVVSLCLCGAYYLQSHQQMVDILKKNIDKFNLITHSSTTSDYKWCADNYLPVTIIPNGIDQSEFNSNSINFREKYNIKEKYILLNIANWFWGKNQQILPHIDHKLRKEINDFKIVQISTSIDYRYDKIFLNRVKKLSNGEIMFLRDIPREDVVAAFKCSDIFLFTSLKEVAPLVILESRAAKLPWVSMDVGDVKSQPGGIVINNSKHDEKGYKIVDNDIVNQFVSQLRYIIMGTSPVTGMGLRRVFVDAGQMNISKIDWKNIVPMYHKVFSE